mmetsp:Transcript_15736/g.38688  ORF Transcript_15736/g.38688 Transcript_15736/m.38688 type:complete len:235 (+) Transcript_15736:101-805(+)
MSTLARMSGKVMVVAIALETAPSKNASSGPSGIAAASTLVSLVLTPWRGALKDLLYMSLSRSNAAKLIAGFITNKQEGAMPPQNAASPPLFHTSFAVVKMPVSGSPVRGFFRSKPLIWWLVATTSNGMVHALLMMPATAPAASPSAMDSGRARPSFAATCCDAYAFIDEYHQKKTKSSTKHCTARPPIPSYNPAAPFSRTMVRITSHDVARGPGAFMSSRATRALTLLFTRSRG